MKSSFPILLATAMASFAVSAAEQANKDAVKAAAKKLEEQANYSWRATVQVPESVQFRPGPTEGKTEKGGITHVTMSFGDNLFEIAKKGEKAAVTDQDGNWQLAADLEEAEGPGRFLARMAQNLRTPAEQVVEILEHTGEFKREGDAYVAELTEEGVRSQFRFGQPQNPKGQVKFWAKDGVLAKMEVKLEAKMDFNGNEFDASRTTTTEISNVGSTKVNVPADAKKKLE